MFLRAPLALPGVRHAFSTRSGGVSPPPWGTLNLGLTVGDDAASVRENRTRFLREAGLGPAVAEVHQVHRAHVVRAEEPSAVDTLREVEADAVWTTHPELTVAVRTADCAPVLIAAYEDRSAPRPAAVAALHAGWRSAAAGIVGRCVSVLAQEGLQPAAMRLVIGPTIGAEAFEVGEEVIEAARASLGGRPPRTRSGPRGRPLLDLPHWVRTLAEQAGLAEEGVADLGRCTVSEPDLFFSHRRDRGRTGRHLSAIRMAP